jgi:son of sevenless-like protein
MVCLEIMTGEQPYSNIPRDITVLRELDHGKIPDRPARTFTARGLNDELWALMRRCWHKKPEVRPSMTLIKAKLAELRGMVAGQIH